MEKFEINILGCGSALPTVKRFTSSQVLNVRDKLFMVDCGEGAQIQLRRLKLHFNRLNHIFISHLHGDHCFGLPGLVSTLGMLGRTAGLVIHAQPDAEKVFRPVLDYFCRESAFAIRFESFDPKNQAVIYEDRSVKVSTLPLKHRVPSTGFLFEEQPCENHLIPDMIAFYQVPVRQLKEIKKGADFVTVSGEVVPNDRLTRPARSPRSYAYCSDTAYDEKLIPRIEGVDLLYHEATFCEADLARARETYHSSARQAAGIARSAHVGKLVLGHFSARYPDVRMLLEEARSVFPNTILAEEGMTIALD
jgi:ribonuclease Z